MSRKTKTPRRPEDPPAALKEALSAIERLRLEGHVHRALERAMALAEQHRDQVHVLFCLFKTQNQLGHRFAAEATATRLVQLRPDDPAFLLAHILSLGKVASPARLRAAVLRLLALAPQHEHAAVLRAQRVQCEAYLGERLPVLLQTSASGAVTLDEDGVAAVAAYEAAESRIHEGALAELLPTLQAVVARLPGFWPARSLLALQLLRCGDPEAALREAELYLASCPDTRPDVTPLTVRALALRWLQRDGADAALQAVRSAPIDRLSAAARLMETLSMCGDDEGVLAVARRRRARQGDALLDPVELAYVLHLEAVAVLRRGLPVRAQSLWEEALRLDPGNLLLAANLAEVRDQPPAERHPFALWGASYLSPAQATALWAALEGEAPAAELQRLLAQQPALRVILSDLLNVGEAAARTLALRVTAASQDSVLLAAAAALAQGARGGRSYRRALAQVARGNNGGEGYEGEQVAR